MKLYMVILWLLTLVNTTFGTNLLYNTITELKQSLKDILQSAKHQLPHIEAFEIQYSLMGTSKSHKSKKPIFRTTETSPLSQPPTANNNNDKPLEMTPPPRFLDSTCGIEEEFFIASDPLNATSCGGSGGQLTTWYQDQAFCCKPKRQIAWSHYQWLNETKCQVPAHRDILDSCEVRRGSVNRCFCRPEYSGAFCEVKTKPSVKCAVNFMEPPVAGGCSGKSSDYYNYSLAGFDPCHFVRTDEKVRLRI